MNSIQKNKETPRQEEAKMEMKVFLLFCIAISASKAFVVEPWLGVNERCNDPTFWCKSAATAKECGVKTVQVYISLSFLLLFLKLKFAINGIEA